MLAETSELTVGRITFETTDRRYYSPPFPPTAYDGVPEREEALARGRYMRLPPVAPAANDNPATPLMIGLTGRRNVGKSTLANLLEAEFGFDKIHAFDSGKHASEKWFTEVTGDPAIAYRMVWDDLKDKPSSLLPGGESPRYFMEKFGHFMGTVMGVDWTLGVEIKKARARSPRSPIVVESVVYEAPWFRKQGGIVVRLERPDFIAPTGVESDGVQALIKADVSVTARSIPELEEKGRSLIRRLLAA